MTASLADLFRREPDAAAFRGAVRALDGDFPFASDDMIALGEAYFERYPDRVRDRNAAEVLIGYAVARAALIEKAVLAVPSSRRDAYRDMFDDVSRVGPSVEALAASAGREDLRADHEALKAALDGLKAVIDDIPKGLVKERFVGGISNLFNILYVIGLKLRGPLL
ncbi:MAG: hypothetical protein KA243_05085 [Candidatus Aminicenantes bacterium]|nr:hypothetical protein [Candidatus Aminicenantes bacterium]NLH75668.1 hypothetical protein [Acidobacteriota bacterium]